MYNIEVDENVYQFLEGKVQGFGDTPNVVLRRLLGIGLPNIQVTKPVNSNLSPVMRKRGKAPKANLRDLVRVGSLAEGQVLNLHDYRGTKINGVQASVRGNDLEFNGQLYAMSALAKEHMKDQGYDNDSYRGPQHWFTAQGRSVKDLWDEYLKAFQR